MPPRDESCSPAKEPDKYITVDVGDYRDPVLDTSSKVGVCGCDGRAKEEDRLRHFSPRRAPPRHATRKKAGAVLRESRSCSSARTHLTIARTLASLITHSIIFKRSTCIKLALLITTADDRAFSRRLRVSLA